MQNRVFFPQASLDQWGIEGKVEVTGSEIVVVAEGRRYDVIEACHVVAEVTGSPDPHEIVGKVKANQTLLAMGAEILENSMIIGDNAYDVVPGWAGRAKTSFAAHLDSNERFKARKGKTDAGALPKSDEEMLERFEAGMLG
ncbi:MAG: hypothetical protein U0270_17190 [Labilithrix sp.]